MRTDTIHTVDPSRLEHGTWSYKKNRQVGEGDIAASYSADFIALHNRIRKPFTFQNGLWVCVGTSHFGGRTSRAYRLTEITHFDGEPTTYAEKTRDSESARNDPNGFYHGMTVNRGGRTYILTGPPAEFTAGNEQQLDLFGG